MACGRPMEGEFCWTVMGTTAGVVTAMSRLSLQMAMKNNPFNFVRVSHWR